MASVGSRLAHSMQASARLHVSRSAAILGRSRHPGVSGVFRDAALAGQNAAMRRGMSSAADPVYDVVVFGGNGFVGSHVCMALVAMGKKVAAINRSGAPREHAPWMDGVDYIAADVFEPEAWRSVLKGAGGVVATIGAFGDYETMKRFNGDANITVAEEAAAAGGEADGVRLSIVPALSGVDPAPRVHRGQAGCGGTCAGAVPQLALDPQALGDLREAGGRDAAPSNRRGAGAGADAGAADDKHPSREAQHPPRLRRGVPPVVAVEAVAKAAAEGAVRELSTLTLLPSDIAVFKH
eukprot:CAMPEP_0180129442 /NCGR_PEP_ID=MMETSP0986-20121125/7314_1 /TAXON_ID=697907 /ORGANISM="non described non described, Strain CCMP2293" /LENGTH=294 /DNA_ID=CAMNT_0022069103 /DNA_START=9 /DNA_END=893 /DNA_ORIENTATION=-